MYVCRYIEDLGVFSVPNYTYDMVDRGQATCSIEQGTPSVQISKDFIPKFFIPNKNTVSAERDSSLEFSEKLALKTALREVSSAARRSSSSSDFSRRTSGGCG